MREVLFRGKRIDNGEWVFGSYVFEPRRKGAFGQTISELDRERHYIVSKKNYEFWEVIPETVGEYTGLTDKNGKKIFEGDTMVFVKGATRPFKIAWDGIGWKMYWNDGKRVKYAWECDEMEYMCSSEIIGNIHDNPELLEVGEQ